MFNQKEYNKIYYQKPEIIAKRKAYYKIYNKLHTKNLQENLRRYKAKLKNILFEKLGRKCIVCGNSDERVLTFNHKDPSLKTKYYYNNQLQAGSNIYFRYVKEMDNLEILCANCHRIKTYEQWQSGILKHNSCSATSALPEAVTEGMVVSENLPRVENLPTGNYIQEGN